MIIDLGLHPRYEQVTINYQYELDDFIDGLIEELSGFEKESKEFFETKSKILSQIIMYDSYDVDVWFNDDISRWCVVRK